MRIYNPSGFPINLPLDNGTRVIVKSGEVSMSILPSTRLLTLIVQSYTRKDIALILDSKSEYDLISGISAAPSYVVSSVEEAINVLGKDSPEKVANVSEKKPEVKKEEELNSPTPEAIEVNPIEVPISSDDIELKEEKRGRKKKEE